MIERQAAIAAWFLAIATLPADAAVVINEVFYHAPGGDEDLQYVELHDAGDRPVELGGWKFSKGIDYQFPAEARIEANGYLVICRNPARFQETYGFAANGAFKGSLKKSGEGIELVDGQGKRVDRVKYDDRPPWPAAADGHSASLERISPHAESDLPQNWASSALSADGLRPAGTPGKQNASFSANLPPVIEAVEQKPAHPAPDQPIMVEAVVKDPDGLSQVTLRYRVAGSGCEKEEESLEMSGVAGNRFTAAIPGQKVRQIIRYRIEAVDQKGARRLHPGPDEPRPAFSAFVHEPFEPGKIPFGLVINVGEAEFKAAAKQRRAPDRGGFSEDDRLRWMGRIMLESGLDLASGWFELTINRQLGFEPLEKLRGVFTSKVAEREKLIETALESSNLQEKMKEIPALVKSFNSQVLEAVRPLLGEEELKKFAEWQGERASSIGGPMGFGPEAFLKRMVNVEGAFFLLSTRSDFTEAQLRSIKPLCQSIVSDREVLIREARNVFRDQGDGNDLRQKVEDLGESMGRKLKPVLSEAQDRDLRRWHDEQNDFFPGRRGASAARAPLPRSAFVFVSQETRVPELYDFVTVTERTGGYKVRFQNDQAFRGMTTINLLFEYQDRFTLAEPLAYELYRRAGNAAELTDFVRLWIDGELLGYHLLVEQPNRSFLRRNKLKDYGNLYKILWYERGVVRQHEKKTNPNTGHDDLVQLIEALEKSKGDEQWEVIEKNFNVEQVINYFAVNTCLSHWDGFFNNYFTYHDVSGSGKWEMYPWDQDKTWGFHDGLRGEVFYDMPLTFGMEGDLPPGWPKDRQPPRGFGGGASWWRPGGYFSKPLLANPRFRKLYLARTREILEKIYTEATFFPIIDGMGERLRDEVRVRAEASRQDPDQASKRLEENLQSLKDHLVKRRKFLLDQLEK